MNFDWTESKIFGYLTKASDVGHILGFCIESSKMTVLRELVSFCSLILLLPASAINQKLCSL